LGYWLLQNPAAARSRADQAANRVGQAVETLEREYFPPEPTATPNVENEITECEDAYRLGDTERAIEVCQMAILGQPNNVVLHYRLAHMLVTTSNLGTDQERLDRAMEIAEYTINAAPESYLGWAIRGMVLDWSGENEKALASLQRAQELDENAILTQAHLANVYRNLGDTELALATIENAVDTLERQGGTNEIVAQVYRNYGRVLWLYQEYTNALDAFQRAWQAMPNQGYIAIDLATTYNILEEPEEALQVLQEALDRNPNDILLLYEMGYYYRYQLGDPTQAMVMFSNCLRSDSNYIPCLSEMGQIQYLANSNYELALENLRQAVELGSEDPYDWYLTGRSYYQLNDCASALPYLRQGLTYLREQGGDLQVEENDFNVAFQACGAEPPL
jgi:tetratricopeptide (TPR) repeat protein